MVGISIYCRPPPPPPPPPPAPRLSAPAGGGRVCAPPQLPPGPPPQDDRGTAGWNHSTVTTVLLGSISTHRLQVPYK